MRSLRFHSNISTALLIISRLSPVSKFIPLFCSLCVSRRLVRGITALHLHWSLSIYPPLPLSPATSRFCHPNAIQSVLSFFLSLNTAHSSTCLNADWEVWNEKKGYQYSLNGRSFPLKHAGISAHRHLW